ncbi:PP2C family serine/threonine-protein phosphatase [Nonomuraea sp. SBT364]|uniref:PP2C family serine/threonine-protein phosphatase n=1 Tax=Nonomuraea sp. SBT364 TaxID=1580530 RepID=UPI00066C8F0C|nr:protein phosphatase 2C domain-containing protein [Nonomuraea sp. SBT364]
MSCPFCEAPVVAGDAFCETCGHSLTSPACTSCGAPAVDAEGYCERCGLRQPTGRDHAELELPDGTAGITDRGLRRARNEDAFSLVPLAPRGTVPVPESAATVPRRPADADARDGGGAPAVVAVVCDGVGSSPRADDASSAAVEAAADALARGLTHEEAFALAGQAVRKLATGPDDAPACTYVAAVARPDRVSICWAGDSRAYWLPDGTLLTEDDVARGGEITAWLGADYPDVTPRTRVFTPPGPGLLLVCSDGLWRYLNGYAFPAAGTPLGMARRMLRHALDSGGHDNVTICLIPLGGTHG